MLGYLGTIKVQGLCRRPQLHILSFGDKLMQPTRQQGWKGMLLLRDFNFVFYIYPSFRAVQPHKSVIFIVLHCTNYNWLPPCGKLNNECMFYSVSIYSQIKFEIFFTIECGDRRDRNLEKQQNGESEWTNTHSHSYFL